MDLKVEVLIEGSKKDIWSVITDIENSHTAISGIEKIEVLEKPAVGLVGLKWRETRTLFGKTATEVMWITDATVNESYSTRAESHGMVYITNLVLSEKGDGTQLTMRFTGVPQSFGVRLLSIVMGFFFKNATKKAVMQDLIDIKAAVEKKG